MIVELFDEHVDSLPVELFGALVDDLLVEIEQG
jgi:hypothetical protein